MSICNNAYVDYRVAGGGNGLLLLPLVRSVGRRHVETPSKYTCRHATEATSSSKSSCYGLLQISILFDSWMCAELYNNNVLQLIAALFTIHSKAMNNTGMPHLIIASV